jgi:hypothetical protein
MKDNLRYEEKGERKLILQIILLLYNFRSSQVGQNKITSVYMPYNICIEVAAIRYAFF